MTAKTTTEIPARGARGFRLQAGDCIRVINTFGAQVVAVWAFVPSDLSEFMSMEHSRVHADSSRPGLGTLFYTNAHRPILEMTTDRSPGVHDWYLAACNQQRYERLGHQGPHGNCTDNLQDVLSDMGHAVPYVPCPLNLFENVPVLFSKAMEIKEPIAMPGDYVGLTAQQACLVILSACPQDIALTNGPDHIPRSVEVEIIGA